MILYNDVNGDGLISAFDLAMVKKHLLKRSLLKDEYLIAGDIFAQNVITIRGLLAMKKHILGIALIN